MLRAVLLVGAFVLHLSHPAYAATYYVDAFNGNDAWAGTQASPAGTNGPWQTLARASKAGLVPGDSLLLKCGATWREGLTITSSGTAATPIIIGRYPESCTDKPILSGATIVPAHAWTHYAGGIYKAQIPANRVRNGAFNAGLANWTHWSSAGNHRVDPESSCGGGSSSCLRLTSGTSSALVSSSSFELQGAEAVNIAYRLQAPAGAQVRVTLRRGSTPYEALGYSVTIAGTGAWQWIVASALAGKSAGNARLDFEAPAGSVIVRIDDVVVSGTSFEPKQVFVGSRPLLPAHHPNRGHDPLKPTSVFAAAAADSNRVVVDGKTVSTYVTMGANLNLPAGQIVTPGLKLMVRSAGWHIDERTVTSVSGSRAYLNAPTTYPLYKDWGYYLTGALWMLDRPGEWYYDPASGELYAWMHDGAAPPDIAVTHRSAGLDISNTAHVKVDGLDIRHFDTGIRMHKTVAARVRSTTLSDNGQFGIDAHWSQSAQIEYNLISNSGRDGVTGISNSPGYPAEYMSVVGNTITNSGVRDGDPTAALPIRSHGAIRPGNNATVTDNAIHYSGYNGIWPQVNARVHRNYISRACMVLNDCGGIYMSGGNTTAQLTHNIIVDPIGNLDGLPINRWTMAQGIYLDELSTNVTVTNNTLVRADNGIQLHNSQSSTISGNTFYGNKRHQLWMEEDTNVSRPSGDVWGNTVTGNRFFPTSPSPAVKHDSKFASVTAFSSYEANRYSTLLSPTIAAEKWSSGSASFTLPEWQGARNSSGAPRNLDITGVEVASIGYAPFRTTGSNIVPNGKFSGGMTGWTVWNQTAPFGSAVLEGCPQGTCLRYTAGASVSLASSPNFSIVKDQWYRASFDAKTGMVGQGIYVTVRRGGGGSNGYELLSSAPAIFTGSVAWKRYSFAFKATKTVNAADPVTGDLGARIDFDQMLPGTTVTIGNVELVPLAPVETTLQTRILLNPTASVAALSCPDAATNPVLCGQFVRFSDNTPVVWPLGIPANSSEAVFSRDPALLDSDGDGIANSQDICPGTAAGAQTNARGCSFDQRPTG